MPRFFDTADLVDDAGALVEQIYQALVYCVNAPARFGERILGSRRYPRERQEQPADHFTSWVSSAHFVRAMPTIRNSRSALPLFSNEWTSLKTIGIASPL